MTKYELVGRLMSLGAKNKGVHYKKKIAAKDEGVKLLNEYLVLNKPVVIESLPLDEDQTWPTRDVLNKLIEATEILLHKKDYDGHGWEEIAYCVDLAKDIEKRIGNVI